MYAGTTVVFSLVVEVLSYVVESFIGCAAVMFDVALSCRAHMFTIINIHV